jgi:hypothetical protein
MKKFIKLENQESIMDEPIWDVRCWLEGLNQGEYIAVTKDGQPYTNADELFREVISNGEYERSFGDGDILIVVYKNADTITLKGIIKEGKKL